MTAPATPAARPAAVGTVDPARASYSHSRWDAERHMFRHTLSYLGNGATYEVSGSGNGDDAVCTCPSYTHSTRRPQWCKHCDHFVAMLEHVEYARQAGRKTWELQTDERQWAEADSLTPDARRMVNAIRAVLRQRGVKSLVAAQKAREAVDELWGEGA